jgi:hypothetical protein
VNTYIKQDGLQNWCQLLDFLYKNLETDKGAEMSLETINIIIEDSGNLLEQNFEKVYYCLIKFITKFVPKLVTSLDQMKSLQNPSEKLFSLVLQSLEYLFDNCPNVMSNYLESIANVNIDII